jgi:signal transduction histidine kinase
MTRRQTASIVFVVLCVLLVGAALTLNISWIMVNGRRLLPLVLGVSTFSLIIAGLIVYTVFLVMEIKRNEEHDSFINAVTHELKTPVASIRLHLETLQRRDLPEARKQEFYRIMLSDADRLTETVEQVLRAGRAGDRRAGREKSEVDFGQLVQDCLEAIRTRHHLSAQAMRYEQALHNGNGVRVLGSPEDLRTAVSNVLENAVKYSGNHIDVAVRLETPDDKRVLLKVKDEGVGIAQEDLKRIFKRFHRVGGRSLAHIKGTGLGLFIVRSIAKKHGGKAFAQSEGEGRGTTVTIELPRISSARADA